METIAQEINKLIITKKIKCNHQIKLKKINRIINELE